MLAMRRIVMSNDDVFIWSASQGEGFMLLIAGLTQRRLSSALAAAWAFWFYGGRKSATRALAQSSLRDPVNFSRGSGRIRAARNMARTRSSFCGS